MAHALLIIIAMTITSIVILIENYDNAMHHGGDDADDDTLTFLHSTDMMLMLMSLDRLFARRHPS